ncbi:V-type ATP synthase subunit C [Halapricum hydrolyticum]|uniref:A-type ATP synthase subunit C n=1 Tax=Halapricum hydrolyticum TaxID=2979991 RepID=A0AAE3IBC9_9EURY|nr:V-type ATP synthase subunit C [Halapricum hydrolyticum]MCU4717853.1 V-type ATP synthase subunit C [Halapricum hydrolyticum]MCU4727017.1 V-type ATP synthase subunit C [Halapricum hydrolyticum]
MSAQYGGPAGEASNYEYVTARVSARRASLFDEDDYRKLVRMGTGEIARFMEETEYGREMNALGARYSGVDLIEYALNRNLAKHFNDLLRWATGEAYDYIARYLRKFDAWNVKTALRGIYSEAGADAIRSDYIRAGEFDDDLLEQLAVADSVEAAIETLEQTIFADALREAYDDYEETNLLVPLENAVDRVFFEDIDEGLPSRVQADRATELYIEFITAEIDFSNVRNALRLARSGADMDPAAYFIDGGRLFDAEELRQLVGNRDQLVEHIRESIYGDDLAEALTELEESDDIVRFENVLDAALLAFADRLANRYPPSVCSVLSYILAKEREVDNIRAIARGREADLAPEEIETELVML